MLPIFLVAFEVVGFVTAPDPTITQAIPKAHEAINPARANICVVGAVSYCSDWSLVSCNPACLGDIPERLNSESSIVSGPDKE